MTIFLPLFEIKYIKHNNVIYRNGRSLFLVTYSQVDKVLCKDKEDFARLVTEEFKDCVVEQWACSEDKHKDGGSHYHLCIKLDIIKRWKLVRQRIQAQV